MAQRAFIPVQAFGQAFPDVFPRLEDAVVQWECVDPETGLPQGETRTMGVKAGYFQGRVPCQARGCEGGGFEFDVLVKGMVLDGLVEKEGLLVCSGWKPGPGPGDEAVPCVEAVRYRIRLRYRGTAAGTPEDPDEPEED